MAGSVVINPASVPVVPGEMAVTTVRIRNTGTVVDQFAVSLVGQPAAWTTVIPAMISLFPGAEGTVDLHVAPPRAPGVGFGPVPFGVRVVASEDADLTIVEEGEVDLRPFVDVGAKLTPRTTESKRKSHHQVIVDNRGNAAVEAEIEAGDPDEHLAFEVRPRVVSVEGGQTARVSVNVAARSGFARGQVKHRPFQVSVNLGGGQPPIVLDGAMVQKPTMPKFIVPLVTAIILVAVMAAVLPGLLKDKGTSNLTTADAPTTTVPEAPPVTEAPPEEAGITEAEAKAAADAELAANGKDPGAAAAPTGAGAGAAPAAGGSTAAASTGASSEGGATPAPTTSAPSEESSSVTSPSAAPPPAYAKFLGEWVNTNATAAPQTFRISAADNTLRLDLPTASTTPYDDAKDGTIVFTTTTPNERHTMSISNDGKLVDVVTNADAAKNRTLTFVKK